MLTPAGQPGRDGGIPAPFDPGPDNPGLDNPGPHDHDDPGPGPHEHGRGHEHQHGHEHGHDHERPHAGGQDPAGAPVVVIRPHSGVSGDIMVAGLAALAGADQERLDELLGRLGLSALVGRVRLKDRSLNSITGLSLEVDVPTERTHRTMADIRELLGRGDITGRARTLALSAFELLAAAEGRVHGRPPSEVAFHEVGALDSVLDMGLAACLFDELGAPELICGPLPVADGTIVCAHGILPSPAPAVSILLEGVAVRGFGAEGETVTPTGLALLKAFGARFGNWPAMVVERQALIYGAKVFAGVPNGALFVLGRRTAPSTGIED
jgi:uncharacterized protein (DUF111 family)